MKIINKSIFSKMQKNIAERSLRRKIIEQDGVFAYYENKKLYFIGNKHFDDLWTAKSLPEFVDEYLKIENQAYWSSVRIESLQYLNYDWNRETTKPESKIFILDNSLENFKKDFPYSCIEEFKEYAETMNRNYRNSWRHPSLNFMLVNYMATYMEKPQAIEMMMKTEFKSFVYEWMGDIKNDKFRKAFGKGKNLSEITTMPNWLWKKLIETHVNIDQWDFIRIWNKQLLQESKKSAETKKANGEKVKDKDIHGFDEGTVDAILNLDIKESKTLKEIKRIIINTKDENGKRMFTIKTLFNYLERVDMYQAIPSYSAIEILADYIRMCTQMGVEPRMDSDSLKREHDIAARNYSLFMDQKREEFEQAKGGLFCERSENLQKYEFEDENYTAIVPKNITDLINEGRNNHNCVGSYVDMFAKGTSNIFFVRKKDNPEKSYITIELNGTCNDYKQAYLASNERITDPRDWEFINKWLDNNKALA